KPPQTKSEQGMNPVQAVQKLDRPLHMRSEACLGTVSQSAVYGRSAQQLMAPQAGRRPWRWPRPIRAGVSSNRTASGVSEPTRAELPPFSVPMRGGGLVGYSKTR